MKPCINSRTEHCICVRMQATAHSIEHGPYQNSKGTSNLTEPYMCCWCGQRKDET